MYRARRTWWIVFGAAVTAVLLALAWITVTVIRLDDARAAGENDRLALWRMDAWLMPRLARESARSYAEYESYHAIDVAYNDQYMQLAPNQVYVASPLLTFESDVFPLHFQFDAQGTVTSPQVPTGNRRDLAEATCLLPGVVPDRENRMAAFVDAVDLDALRHRVETSVDVPAMTAAATPVPIPWIADAAGQTEVGQTARSLAEQSKRADGAAYANSASQTMQQSYLPDAEIFAPVVEVTSFVPVWIGPPGRGTSAPPGPGTNLIVARLVRLEDRSLVQGFLVDWPRLRAALLAEIADLAPVAVLEPVVDRSPGDTDERVLASIPARLTIPAQASGVGMSSARLTMLFTWIGILVAIVAIGLSLTASIRFGDRRARFATAVTHELRTPLTTFRMYSEMLADDMVPDAGRRREYLLTLKDQSTRLATLVENVLAYARIEEGRASLRPRVLPVSEVVLHGLDALRRRAAEVDMSIEVTTADIDDLTVRTDPDAIGQILLNLVDNACKYARDATTRTIHVHGRRERDAVVIAVRDHGPGIERRQVRHLFDPFRRGEHESSGTTPGVGLGLSIARCLARDLGGDLVHRASTDGGACFELTMPLAGA